MQPRPFDFRPDVDYTTDMIRVIRSADGTQLYTGFIRDVRGWLAQREPVIDLQTEAAMTRPRWRNLNICIIVAGRRYNIENWYCDVSPAAIEALEARQQ